MFGYVWKYGKSYVTVKTITAILSAILRLPSVILPDLIINELAGEQKISVIFLLTGLLLLIPFFGGILESFLNKIIAQYGRQVSVKIKAQFFDRLNDIAYERFDNPDFEDIAYHNLDLVYKMTDVVDQVGDLITNFISILAITSIILTLSPVTILVVVACMILNSFVTKWINKKQYEAEKEMSKYERLIDGTTDPFGAGFLKEIRMFDLKEFLIQNYRKAKRGENSVRNSLEEQRSRASILMGLTGAAQQIYLYAYLVYRVLATGLSVGSMTIYMNAANQFSGALNSFVGSYLSLANNGLTVEDIESFNSTPTAIEESGTLTPVFDADSVIEFRNVSLKYPGSENYALQNINLTLRGDEKLCIVGENGGGKSTFIKLLTRLYKPTEGEILLNGVNIREYDYEKYQNLFASVLQRINFFHISLKTNIVLTSPYDRDKLNEIGWQSDIDGLVQKLPREYDTPMYKIISPDGFEPSGGEEQKIAIARSCYHGGDIFILDEPTSALDPLAEGRMFGQFENMIKDKAAVLITHRLSAVKLADHVAVFDKGRMVEYGTHDEVYGMGGLYTEMYDKQAEFYVKK